MKKNRLILLFFPFVSMILSGCGKTIETNGIDITWCNDDGSVLYTEINVDKGSVPVYPFENPTSTQNNPELEFAGWSPNVGKVYFNTTYTALYNNVYNPTYYNIYYVTNGGENPYGCVSSFYYGQEGLELPTPTKTDYVFNGWCDELGNIVDELNTYQTCDITLYAKWTYAPAQCHVYIFSNCEYFYSSEHFVNRGSAIQLQAYSIGGYQFDGWYIDGSLYSTSFDLSYYVYYDVDIEARYHEVQSVYYIYYDLDGGTNSPFNPYSYTAGDSFEFADPTKEGYEFLGWFDNYGYQVVRVYTYSTGDLHLYAQWEYVGDPCYNIYVKSDPEEVGYDFHYIIDRGDSLNISVPDVPEGYEFKYFLFDDESKAYSPSLTINDINRHMTIYMCFNRLFDYEIYSGYSLMITAYNGDNPNVVIPTYIDGYPVEAIGPHAFESRSDIVSVTLHSGISYIGQYAFCGTSITEFIGTPNLTYIGVYLFENCSDLRRVDLSSCQYLTSISHYCFALCTNLEEFCFPPYLEEIGSMAFCRNDVPIDIYIPKTVTTVSQISFYNCPYMNIYVTDEAQTASWPSDWYQMIGGLYYLN